MTRDHDPSTQHDPGTPDRVEPAHLYTLLAEHLTETEPPYDVDGGLVRLMTWAATRPPTAFDADHAAHPQNVAGELVRAEDGDLVDDLRKEVSLRRAEAALDLQRRRLALQAEEAAIHEHTADAQHRRDLAVRRQEADLAERAADAEHRRHLERLELEVRLRAQAKAPARRLILLTVGAITAGTYTTVSLVLGVPLATFGVGTLAAVYMTVIATIALVASIHPDESRRHSAHNTLRTLWPFDQLPAFVRRVAARRVPEAGNEPRDRPAG